MMTGSTTTVVSSSSSSSSSATKESSSSSSLPCSGTLNVSVRAIVLMAAGMGALIVVHIRGYLRSDVLSVSAVSTTKGGLRSDVSSPVTISSLRPNNNNNDDDWEGGGNNDNNRQCRFFLAESAIPKSGLGLFTGVGLHPGDTIGFPDICIYVGDMPRKPWTHLHSHTWGGATFFLQYEGVGSRIACEGFASTYNTMPNEMINTEIESVPLPTNAGLDRASHPGAGAITHHFGISSVATDVVRAGSELTIDYGDWDFAEDAAKDMKKPERTVQELRQKGWCIDNMEVKQATDPEMGRGAFAVRRLSAGTVVGPGPLQVFQDRALFAKENSEQLYVNYCFQPPNSPMMFYPYGPGINLINHGDSKTKSRRPNVHLRWSNNTLHHQEWLNMTLQKFWEVAYPGGLVLEVVASRDIRAGEELFLNYGTDWENAWKKHVENWKPIAEAENYVYPQDMDDTEPLRTVYEQRMRPYPENIGTMCNTPNWDRPRGNITWMDHGGHWWEGMTPCAILERRMGISGDFIYAVALTRSAEEFNFSVPVDEQFVDVGVPRRAIRFVELPYADDEHLPGAFRHPIELPPHLFPAQWREDDKKKEAA